jgi:hypothetical protein
MRLVAGAREVYHAVQTSEGCSIALVAMPIELLFGENISAVLLGHSQLSEQL